MNNYREDHPINWTIIIIGLVLVFLCILLVLSPAIYAADVSMECIPLDRIDYLS